MTATSADSLMPDVPKRTEAEARIARAIEAAREGQRAIMIRSRSKDPDYIGASLDGYEALCKIVGALTDGKGD